MVIFKIWFLSKLFWRTRSICLNESEDFWDDISVFALLNHTSLLEPIFFAGFPLSFLVGQIKRVEIPGADITLDRPIFGFFYRSIFPRIKPITRKRDKSWTGFMEDIRHDTLVVIAPEGRMMRKDGLDKHGKPMTIKTGIVDIIKKREGGHILLAYSKGLHHVFAPGDLIPKPFREIEISFEKININELKKELEYDKEGFSKRLIKYLEDKRQRHCYE
tara:strand:- start:53798 stop:54451 length:654 start_codon:yes stop_codon:yes gene_type:complete